MAPSTHLTATAGGPLAPMMMEHDNLSTNTKIATPSSSSSSTHYNEIQPNAWSEEIIQKAIREWNLTPSEVTKLRDIQHRIADVQHWRNDPNSILYFMRGPFGGNSPKSIEQQFRKAIAWRIHNQIDDMLQNYMPPRALVEGSTISSFLRHDDREGDPIYVERGGAMNPGQLLKTFSKEEMVQYAIWIRELHTRGAWKDAYERRHGHPVRTMTIVYDLKGMSSSHLKPSVVDVFQEVMRITKDYYSVPVKRMIIIRAPAIFRLGWSIVKHIFPAAARKKMIFCGNDNYLDVLDKYIDLDVLPSCIYGGGRGGTAEGLPKLIGEEDTDKLLPDASTTSNTTSESLSWEEDSGEEDLSDNQRVTVSCRKLASGTWGQPEQSSKRMIH